ncbi:TRAP transporter large permease [bacterium]|nr:TRAP transporter large permease [bacterium]
MDPLTVGCIGIGVLILLLFSGIPIGVAMGVTGVAGMLFIAGPQAALGLMERIPYDTTANYAISVVPLFILMGSFCFYAGISQDLYRTMYKWIGHFRGGLAMATVGACASFAAVSGSSLATAATMGTVALPEMKKYKYDDRLATGAVAAGGTIGILIPPSVILILYGIIAEQSIGKLFLAGFIPGVLEAAFYLLTIYVLTLNNPVMGPRGPRTALHERLVSLKDVWIVLVLFLLVIGGIYLGVFSPTEAGGIGAFGAFLFALGRGRLGWRNFYRSLLETGKTSAMIFIIVIGATLLGAFLAVTRLPYNLAEMVSVLPVNRYVILVLILLVYIILGCIMDSMAMVLLTVPIFFPVAMALGFDPIWFGIIIVRVTEMGQITPPVGINVFVIKGVAKEVPMGTIFKGIIPFFIADICHVALLVAVPQLALFLPGLLR